MKWVVELWKNFYIQFSKPLKKAPKQNTILLRAEKNTIKKNNIGICTKFLCFDSQNAIRRIDRETRQLLQDTYDAVNRSFGELFPILFGGGTAKLVMTGEEILDSGVQVMAQPPGKKNSSIHLLSGGEKALTAIALVFSLFLLNPAPFCLLDEVDAPLDDANVSKFTNMIREFSENSQFIIVTHNKMTMSTVDVIYGVTMQEPGVSKLVTVDFRSLQ